MSLGSGVSPMSFWKFLKRPILQNEFIFSPQTISLINILYLGDVTIIHPPSELETLILSSFLSVYINQNLILYFVSTKHFSESSHLHPPIHSPVSILIFVCLKCFSLSRPCPPACPPVFSPLCDWKDQPKMQISSC